MGYDEALAQPVRGAPTGQKVTGKAMFDGITFMLEDKMHIGMLQTTVPGPRHGAHGLS